MSKNKKAKKTLKVTVSKADKKDYLTEGQEMLNRLDEKVAELLPEGRTAFSREETISACYEMWFEGWVAATTCSKKTRKMSKKQMVADGVRL